MSYVNGIHHYMLKCCSSEEFEKAVFFYRDVLKLPVVWEFGNDDESAVMLDTGAGCVEIFSNAKNFLPMGAIRHIALSTLDADACFNVAVNAGCTVVTEPKDIVIPANPPVCARIAFVTGPVGEEIEFFQTK